MPRIYRFYTNEEDAVLRDICTRGGTIHEALARLDRPFYSIYQRIRILGLELGRDSGRVIEIDKEIKER